MVRLLLCAAFALAALLPAAAAQSCEDGMAGDYPCTDVDLLAHLSLEVFEAESGNDIWGWTDPETGSEYALMGLNNGTAFVDISTPGAPVYLGKLPTATTATVWRDVKVYRDHAFIVSEAPGHGMQVFDLAHLRDLALDATPMTFEADAMYTGVGNTHNIVIDEDSGFAYLVGANGGGFECNGGGLHMVDIRTMLEPTFAGCFDTDGYTHDAQCIVYDGPDTEYTGRQICFASNEDTMTIADVTDKAEPLLISRVTYANPSYTHQGWLTDDRRYFVANDELDGNASETTRSIIFDVSDLDNPDFVDFFFGPTAAIDHNLYIHGDLVWMSNYEAGLRINRIDADGSIEEVGYFDSYPASDETSFNGQWSNYPYFESGVVIASDINGGLFILQPEATRRTTGDASRR